MASYTAAVHADDRARLLSVLLRGSPRHARGAGSDPVDVPRTGHALAACVGLGDFPPIRGKTRLKISLKILTQIGRLNRRTKLAAIVHVLTGERVQLRLAHGSEL